MNINIYLFLICVAFRTYHGHAILLLEASVDCPYDMVGPQSSGGARPVHSNARMPSCHIYVAERHEGILSAYPPVVFGVKFVLFQLLGTLANY